MRDLKFRAKRKDNGEWIYWNLLDGIPNGTLRLLKLRDVIDEKTLGQDTGLTDKSGDEIYEGDIIKDGWSENNIGVVKFAEIGGYFDLDIGYMECMHAQSDDSEIIGNIYDNPELLPKTL